jgi:Cu+-exporting ATPase
VDEGKQRLRHFGFAGAVGILLLLNVSGIFTTVFGIDTAAILTLVAGYRIFYNAISDLLQKKISADLAICVAVVAALAIGEYVAACEAMLIMLIGESLEGYAAGRTAAAIHRFVEQLPRRARLIKDGEEVEVDAATLVPDDLIVVRSGERIAADGQVVQGSSSIDESTITGESLPRDKEIGDEVFSGTLNGHGMLVIQVTRAGEDTTLARVIRLVEEAKEKKAPVERLADRYARYFLPALLVVAAATFYFTRDWLRTVSVLIVACPCALVLAVPAAMVSAIGGLARRGILVRGATVLQNGAKVDTIVFDKTGTVTEGRFNIARIIMVDAAGENELLALAAAAESGSDHVLARVIVEEAQHRNLYVPQPDEAHILPGRGAVCQLGGRQILAGSGAFLAEHGITDTAHLLEEADKYGATAVLVAVVEQVPDLPAGSVAQKGQVGDLPHLAGAILLRDRVREGIKQAVHELQHMGITNQVMLTGDRRRAAEAIAREIGIPDVEAELLPEQKLDRIKQYAAHGRTVAMVGDGINDAPALAAADVGIAVAGASDITAEAADVVYLGHSLEKLPRFFDVSRRAVTTVWQNIIVFAAGLNAVAILAAATGRLGPLGAAVTHQVGSLLVILNSLRLLRVEKERHGGFRHRLEHVLGPAWRRARRLASAVDPKAGFDWLVAHREQLAKPALATAAALVVLSGVYTLGPDESGVIERFGRKVLPYKEPGLHYKLPWPIERLTRIKARQIRVVEVGFRSSAAVAGSEPATYEWNVQHRSGRFQRKPEESLMLTGDQNMVEVNATVHYRLDRPDDFLFNQLDGDGTMRAAAESVLQSVITGTPIDDALTTRRKAIEERVLVELQRRVDRYGTGATILHVKLLDVHPSLEVVDAYREVSGAFEEKNRMINEAEAYRNEQVALARGNAEAQLEIAEAYSIGRKNRAAGDADRFLSAEGAYRTAPGPTETRLYLETMELVLPGKRKLIVDESKGRRHLLLLEDGVEIAAPAMPILAPQRRIPEE